MAAQTPLDIIIDQNRPYQKAERRPAGLLDRVRADALESIPACFESNVADGYKLPL
jgi:hypothetical protein